MNQRTSNTFFLGSVLASVALVALLAPPASATEPVPVTAPASTAPASTAPVSEQLCTDTICITAPLEQVVDIAPRDTITYRDAASIRLQTATYTTPAGMPSFQSDTAFRDTVTVLGRIEQDSRSAADPLLGTQPAFMPDNMGDLDTVDSVTGLGIVSTF